MQQARLELSVLFGTIKSALSTTGRQRSARSADGADASARGADGAGAGAGAGGDDPGSARASVRGSGSGDGGISARRSLDAAHDAVEAALVAFLARHSRQRNRPALEGACAARGSAHAQRSSVGREERDSGGAESAAAEAKRLLARLCAGAHAAQSTLWALGAKYLEVPPPPLPLRGGEADSEADGGADSEAPGEAPGELPGELPGVGGEAADEVELRRAAQALDESYATVKALPDVIRAAHAAGSAAFKRRVSAATTAEANAKTDTLRTMLMNRMLTSVAAVTVDLSAPRMRLRRGLLFALESV